MSSKSKYKGQKYPANVFQKNWQCYICKCTHGSKDIIENCKKRGQPWYHYKNSEIVEVKIKKPQFEKSKEEEFIWVKGEIKNKEAEPGTHRPIYLIELFKSDFNKKIGMVILDLDKNGELKKYRQDEIRKLSAEDTPPKTKLIS
jgi:hypothetical protein